MAGGYIYCPSHLFRAQEQAKRFADIARIHKVPDLTSRSQCDLLVLQKALDDVRNEALLVLGDTKHKKEARPSERYASAAGQGKGLFGQGNLGTSIGRCRAARIVLAPGTHVRAV